MRSVGSRVLLSAVLATASIGGTSCYRACEDDCSGQGVYVSWVRGEIPRAASYWLCAEGACHDVIPNEFDSKLSVSAPAVDDEVDARLELLDDAGATIATLRGTGHKRGTCCRAAYLRATRAGRLVPDDGSSD